MNVLKHLIAPVILCCLLQTAQAQQRIDRSGMNYLVGVKPNNIMYRDTLYAGAKQFMPLFYRTGDPELIRLYHRHQSNKIAGQILGVAGSLATIAGLSMLSSTSNKGAGWALLGGGFATTLTGGYLIFRGQQNLLNAVVLFNHKHNRASIGLGAGNRNAGLVMTF